MNTLEAIRAAAGAQPIEILSGYRTEAYQARLFARAREDESTVASVATSQHPRGEAADIRHVTLAVHGRSHVLRLFEPGQLPESRGLRPLPPNSHTR